jgi:hypothetical protein
MKWRKLGLVFKAQGQLSWMQSHGAVPVAEPLDRDVVAVYFATRDNENRGHTARLILSLETTAKVLQLDSSPILAPGALGCFDDSGAMPSWLTSVGTDRYLYYIGWNRCVSVPFRNSTGLAVSRLSGPFQRVSTGPVLDRSIHEPHFATNPCVLKDGDVWRMWYLSCIGWDQADSGPRHRYHLKYVESRDGIDWRPDGRIAIDFASPEEYAISRPCVVRDGSLWRMWYSVRGSKYRIGYAESADGINWMRLDHRAGISVSETGWDSDSVEYAFVFDHFGSRWMLYNGNDYGRTGFGLAVLEA